MVAPNGVGTGKSDVGYDLATCPSLNPEQRSQEGQKGPVVVAACHLAQHGALARIDERLQTLGYYPKEMNSYTEALTPEQKEAMGVDPYYGLHHLKDGEVADPRKISTENLIGLQFPTPFDVFGLPIHPLVGARVINQGNGYLRLEGNGFEVLLSDGDPIDYQRMGLLGDLETIPNYNVVIADTRPVPFMEEGEASVYMPSEESVQRTMYIDQGLCTFVTAAGGKREGEVQCQEVSDSEIVVDKLLSGGWNLLMDYYAATFVHWVLSSRFMQRLQIGRLYRWGVEGVNTWGPRLFGTTREAMAARYALASNTRMLHLLAKTRILKPVANAVAALKTGGSVLYHKTVSILRSPVTRQVGVAALVGGAAELITGEEDARWYGAAGYLADRYLLGGRIVGAGGKTLRFAGKPLQGLSTRLGARFATAKFGGWLARRGVMGVIAAGAVKWVPILGLGALIADGACELGYSRYNKYVHEKTTEWRNDNTFMGGLMYYTGMHGLSSLFFGSAHYAGVADSNPEIKEKILAQHRAMSQEITAGMREMFPGFVLNPDNFDPTDHASYTNLSFDFLNETPELSVTEEAQVKVMVALMRPNLAIEKASVLYDLFLALASEKINSSEKAIPIIQKGVNLIRDIQEGDDPHVALEAFVKHQGLSEEDLLALFNRYQIGLMRKGLQTLHFVDQDLNDWARDHFDVEEADDDETIVRFNGKEEDGLVHQLMPELPMESGLAPKDLLLLVRQQAVATRFISGDEIIFGKDRTLVARAAGIIDEQGNLLWSPGLDGALKTFYELFTEVGAAVRANPSDEEIKGLYKELKGIRDQWIAKLSERYKTHVESYQTYEKEAIALAQTEISKRQKLIDILEEEILEEQTKLSRFLTWAATEMKILEQQINPKLKGGNVQDLEGLLLQRERLQNEASFYSRPSSDAVFIQPQGSSQNEIDAIQANIQAMVGHLSEAEANSLLIQVKEHIAWQLKSGAKDPDLTYFIRPPEENRDMDSQRVIHFGVRLLSQREIKEVRETRSWVLHGSEAKVKGLEEEISQFKSVTMDSEALFREFFDFAKERHETPRAYPGGTYDQWFRANYLLQGQEKRFREVMGEEAFKALLAEAERAFQARLGYENFSSGLRDLHYLSQKIKVEPESRAARKVFDTLEGVSGTEE